ncbi:hypothetical protein FLLO111716_10105 [Flavobacterium longum]|uniref:T9SS type A sorting domain-containing protein n=1 Tax=Flavobacterium longum TaxID=1299340 RepID=UPI0039E9A041
MKKFYLFVLLSLSVQSQTFQWLNVASIDLNLNPDMVGYPVTVDLSGNVYLAGFKGNPYVYTDIMGDVLFHKYDNGGALQFEKLLTGRVNVYDMACDHQGNLFMVIGYINTITIGDTTLSTTAQGVQPLLAKFDDAGNLLWHYTPVITGSFEPYFRALATDGQGNVYIGYDNFMDSYIQKLSPDGQPQLTITNEQATLLSSVDIDTEGNIYIAGSCAETNAQFAGTPFPNDLAYDGYIVKYTPDGTCQWVRYIQDFTCSLPQVKVNTPDQVYFASALNVAAVFGNITAQGPGAGFGDFFVSKLDAAGNFQWVAEVPSGNTGTVSLGGRDYIDVDAQGNVVFAGSTRNSIAWTESIATLGQGFSNDGILLKYHPDGTLLFAKTFGGASHDRVDGVAFDGNGGIVVSGMARGNATFDSFSHEVPGLTLYPYIGKISAVLGNPEVSDSDIVLWPNPVQAMLYLSGEDVSGVIYNMIGQKVKEFDAVPGQPIDVSALPSGVYLLNTSQGSVKFIKS